MGVVVALLAVLIFCSAIGYSVKQTNLGNQRSAALKFLSDYPNPDIETIRFTREGSVSGSGSWSANAVVTIGDKDYDEILGIHVSGGNPLPTIAAKAAPGPATVIYSDGSSEVLKP